LHMLKKIYDRGQRDFTAIFICTTVNFRPAHVLRTRHAAAITKTPFPAKLFLDIPRSDTIQAFREADLFAFPSEVEVAPLVILETMAVGTPWVGLNVGNLPTLEGGKIVRGERKKEGRWVYSTEMHEEFQNHMLDILNDDDLNKRLGEDAILQVVDQFNWENIKHKYHEIFTGIESECLD